MTTLRAQFALGPFLALASQVCAQSGGPYTLTWNTLDGGGGTGSGGPYTLSGTAGQPEAGRHAGQGLALGGGFWSAFSPAACYANCDGSAVPPILNVNDFVCFQVKFAAGDAYANCDSSTVAPVLNVNDFICFQVRFATGCP